MATTDPKSSDHLPTGQALTPAQQAANFNILKRNIAIAGLIVCPILIALPPRKLDVYTIGLGASTFLSLNHLQKHTTGRSFLNRIGINDPGKPAATSESPKDQASGGWGGLPTERARQYQQLLKEKKAAEAAGKTWIPRSPEEAVEVKKEEQRGVLESVWMGREGEDWKAKRDRKEREALERGDSVGTLIQDYFAEAVGFKKDDEDEDDTNEKK